MSAFDRVEVIFNPHSTGDAPARAAELVAQLHAGDPELEVVSRPTQHAGHARELAAAAAAAAANPLIVSVSGDGGFNEVVDGVVSAGNTGAAAAVLAAGNANDHRRTTRERPLAEAILDHDVRRMDVLRMRLTAPDPEGGDVRVLHAHSYIGLGLSPLVAIELKKHTKGSLWEIVTTARTFRKYQPFTIERSHGLPLVFDSVVFANIGQMAKYVTLAENADPDDGLFELVVIKHHGRLGTFLAAARAATRGLGTAPQIREYRFRTVKPTPLQTDGEIVDLPAGVDVVVDLEPHGLLTVR